MEGRIIVVIHVLTVEGEHRDRVIDINTIVATIHDRLVNAVGDSCVTWVLLEPNVMEEAIIFVLLEFLNCLTKVAIVVTDGGQD